MAQSGQCNGELNVSSAGGGVIIKARNGVITEPAVMLFFLAFFTGLLMKERSFNMTLFYILAVIGGALVIVDNLKN